MLVHKPRWNNTVFNIEMARDFSCSRRSFRMPVGHRMVNRNRDCWKRLKENISDYAVIVCLLIASLFCTLLWMCQFRVVCIFFMLLVIRKGPRHYNDGIMTTIASQITSLTIVYSTVYSDADQSKHQSSASLAFVWGIHRGPVNSPHKWPVTRKMFPFDDVIMEAGANGWKISVSSRAICGTVYNFLSCFMLFSSFNIPLPRNVKGWMLNVIAICFMFWQCVKSFSSLSWKWPVYCQLFQRLCNLSAMKAGFHSYLNIKALGSETVNTLARRNARVFISSQLHVTKTGAKWMFFVTQSEHYLWNIITPFSIA